MCVRERERESVCVCLFMCMHACMPVFLHVCTHVFVHMDLVLVPVSVGFDVYPCMCVRAGAGISNAYVCGYMHCITCLYVFTYVCKSTTETTCV